MRALTNYEIAEIKSRCAGLNRSSALIEAGRWLGEHLVLHWTGADVDEILYGKKLKIKRK